MKKTLLISMGLAFFLGCSPDLEKGTEIESVDLTKIINPNTARAVAEFDSTSSGIYKGVFVANDMSYHGILTVNFGNDSQYNAVLEYGDSERIGFIPVNMSSTSASKVMEFRGLNSGFTLNVSDYNQPVVSEGYINGQKAQAKLLKETSTNQVRAVLGTFTDDSDPSFTGTWDLLSNATQIISLPTGLTFPFPPTVDVEVNIISEVVLTKNATLFNDNMMEDFTLGSSCSGAFPTGSQAPYFTGPQVVGGIISIDEYIAGSQTSTFIGEDCTWSFIYSFALGGKYYDVNCNETPAGGTFSWKGRTGHILLD